MELALVRGGLSYAVQANMQTTYVKVIKNIHITYIKHLRTNFIYTPWEQILSKQWKTKHSKERRRMCLIRLSYWGLRKKMNYEFQYAWKRMKNCLLKRALIYTPLPFCLTKSPLAAPPFSILECPPAVFAN